MTVRCVVMQYSAASKISAFAVFDLVRRQGQTRSGSLQNAGVTYMNSSNSAQMMWTPRLSTSLSAVHIAASCEGSIVCARHAYNGASSSLRTREVIYVPPPSDVTTSSNACS